MSIATDPNLAALLDETAYTVDVMYQSNNGAAAAKPYTFVTNIPGIRRGDFLLVEGNSPIIAIYRNDMPTVAELEQEAEDSAPFTMSLPNLVRCTAVHEGVCIEPGSSIRYKWIVAKLDFSYYQELIERNRTLTATVAESYKRAARKGVREQLLSLLPTDEQVKLKGLLGTAGCSMQLPVTSVGNTTGGTEV